MKRKQTLAKDQDIRDTGSRDLVGSFTSIDRNIRLRKTSRKGGPPTKMPIFSERPDPKKMPTLRNPSPVMKPLSVLAVPGMFLFYKYNEYKRQHQVQPKRTVTEKELDHLNQKIDKLLAKMDDPEVGFRNVREEETKEEEECVICMSAKATMKTFPCEHKVVCRKCFVKTIQTAIAQRCLPLRCVVCRSQIMKLKQISPPPTGTRNRKKSKTNPYKKFSAKIFAKENVQLPV